MRQSDAPKLAGKTGIVFPEIGKAMVKPSSWFSASYHKPAATFGFALLVKQVLSQLCASQWLAWFNDFHGSVDKR
jgi:hypothetical protein